MDSCFVLMDCDSIDPAVECWEDEEIEILEENVNSEESWFDSTVGRIQEVVLSHEFYMLQHNFIQRYCQQFSNSEENKHTYMEIFSIYLTTIEGYIESHLQNVDLQVLARSLIDRKDQVDTPLLDMLLSFSDFLVFKEMMVSAKDALELSIQGKASVLHRDEMEDGEERADLEGLLITPLTRS